MPAAIRLYGYQQRWFADRARFKLGRWSRQVGKTFTTTLEIIDDCFAAESEGRRTRWVILSRGERQAREAIDACKMHAQAYSLGIEELSSEYAVERDDGSRATYKQLEIRLPGGSRIIGLPANADTARGFSANVFLDEFAFHQDSRAIWKALFPVISAGYRLIVTSTPNGKGNKFYDLASGTGGRWSRHVVDIHQAVADGLPRDIDELREGLDDDDAWRQEYLLEWLDEASAWLDFDLITSAEHDAAGDPAGYQGGPCYVGNDIGRRRDLWVAWVWEQVGDVLWTREISILRGASFSAHDAELDRIIGTSGQPGAYRVVRLHMDQTGMGEKPVEDAIRRYGASRVQGVLFTGPAKLGMATHGKQMFQDRRARIPMGDRKLRADLHSLRKVNSPSGAPRFDAADEEGTDSHADRAWAAFLGLDAAAGGGAEYAYHPVHPSGTQPPGDHLRSRRADEVAAAAQPRTGAVRRLMTRRGAL